MTQKVESPGTLKLNYSGRIIDHLGLQMYQSPVAAIAELVANAWDADAENVWITLPDSMNPGVEIVIKDDGNGMTFKECQDRFLNVGYARRGKNSTESSKRKDRKILGRKGIGKFAGFGISKVIRIQTTSFIGGEFTDFAMDIDKLRSEEYVKLDGTPVDLNEYREAVKGASFEPGTVVRLSQLVFAQLRNPDAFRRSMARRFLLHQTASDFKVFVNNKPLPESEELIPLQFSFPRDYRDKEKPKGIKISDEWGTEALSDGQIIRWRIRFYEDTINDEELRGVAVFAGGKVVQTPFFFNLSGGLPGQFGQQYVSGQVQADFLDEQQEDLIAPERQRVSWENQISKPLADWGQDRIRQLLAIWRERRGEERERDLQNRIVGFSSRLNNLESHEQRTVSGALRRLAQIETLSQSQFDSLGDAMLTAWEQGRLRELTDEIGETGQLTADDLISILAEADVLTALNTAEAIKTKLRTVGGLKQRIENKELENAVRDYIGKNPWLVSPSWEMFKVEKSVGVVLQAARGEAGLSGADMAGRIDLALSSGDQLLVLEFMRPGLTVNWDHINRFDRYVRTVRTNLLANTAARFRRVTGYLVADHLEKTQQ